MFPQSPFHGKTCKKGICDWKKRDEQLRRQRNGPSTGGPSNVKNYVRGRMCIYFYGAFSWFHSGGHPGHRGVPRGRRLDAAYHPGSSRHNREYKPEAKVESSTPSKPPVKATTPTMPTTPTGPMGPKRAPPPPAIHTLRSPVKPSKPQSPAKSPTAEAIEVPESKEPPMHSPVLAEVQPPISRPQPTWAIRGRGRGVMRGGHA